MDKQNYYWIAMEFIDTNIYLICKLTVAMTFVKRLQLSGLEFE